MIIRRQNTEDRIQNTEDRTENKKDRKIFISFIWLLASGFWLLFLSSCSPSQERLYKETRDSMYTMVSITVSSVSPEKAKKAINEAFKELDRLAQLLNYYSEKSEITAINRKAGIEPVKVSPETFDIMSKAVFASEKTKGAFDITMGPVIALWDFYNAVLPDAASVREKLKLTGYTNIILNKEKSTVFLKKKGIEINLGGIIKGYAADRAVEILKKHGIKSGIVAVAGDIKTFGTRPDGKPWRAGIQNPRTTPPIPPLARGGDGGGG